MLMGITWHPMHDAPSRLTHRLGASLLLAALLIPSAGCYDNGRGMRQQFADGDDLPILRHAAAPHCHETRAMQVVVRDAAGLARIPLQDVPVDFDEEMLLIATLGRVPSDQYSVHIERVWREGHRLRVSVVVERPPPNAPLVVASPYCIAVVPRCDLNVEAFDPEPPRRERSWGQSEPGVGG